MTKDGNSILETSPIHALLCPNAAHAVHEFTIARNIAAAKLQSAAAKDITTSTPHQRFSQDIIGLVREINRMAPYALDMDLEIDKFTLEILASHVGGEGKIRSRLVLAWKCYADIRGNIGDRVYVVLLKLCT